MAIITKPSTISKGEAASIQLNKSELASVASVAADEYYSDSSNWSKVILNYKSEEINQFHVVTFDATQSSPSSSFLASERAWDVFQILSIDIIDFDNGFFRIDASELVASEFEIDMGTIAPTTGIPFQLHAEYEIVNPALNPTYLENQTDSLYVPVARALSNVSIGSINSGVANFDITFNLSNFSASDNGSGMGTQVGLYCTDVAPELMDISVLNSQPWDGNTTIQALLYGNYAGTWRKARMHGDTVATGAGYGPLGTELAYIDPATVIRIKQTGNTIEFYRNGNLFSTVDTSSSTFSCMYMYPFTYGSKHTVNSVVVADTNNYIVWDNISGGAATDINGKLYKGLDGTQPQGVSNTSIGTFDGTYSLTFVMSDVNSYGIFAGLSANPLGTSGSWVTLLGGSLGFRDSNGADTALGSYSTTGDITIKLTYTAQTIQIFLNNVEVLAPTALFSGFIPSQPMYPFAIVSPYAGTSTNVNTGLDIIKEASYSN